MVQLLSMNHYCDLHLTITCRPVSRAILQEANFSAARRVLAGSEVVRYTVRLSSMMSNSCH